MKRFLPVTVAFLVALALPAQSQPTNVTLELYADEFGTECNVVDAPGVVIVYIMIEGNGYIKGVQIGAPKPDCWTGATHIGDASTIDTNSAGGNTQLLEGIEPLFVLFDCAELPIYLGFMLFSSAGTSLPCCTYPVFSGQHFGSPLPRVSTCNDEWLLINPGDGVTINGDDTCPCMLPIPVEDTSWGRVKALYN